MASEEQKARNKQEYTEKQTEEEAYLNRGIVTVFEETKNHGEWSKGDRYVVHGKEPKRHIYDEDEEDFIVVAVPLAYIELPETMTEAEFDEWISSHSGKLALWPFFPDLEVEGVLTEWGEQKGIMEGYDA